jgi:uncharacterized protein YjbI with pentapeptide repeats
MPKKLTIFKQNVNKWNKEQGLGKAVDVFKLASPPHKELNFHDFSNQALDTIDFSSLVIGCSTFQNALLSYARFCESRLAGTDFQGATLIGADFSFARCNGTEMFFLDKEDTCASQNTRFNNAILDRAIFHNAFLSRADFSNASLQGTKFVSADLTDACFENAVLDNTVFSGVDLSTIIGLDTVTHKGRSYIDLETLILSKGKISEKFLRGCGVSNQFIEYLPSLVAGNVIQYYSCFISYSSSDEGFTKRLHVDLQDNGVRCWYAPEDMKIGARIRPAIDQSIRIHDKLLIVLSENSIRSKWVEKEIETAFEKERKDDQVVLFPIRLDNAVMETNEAWAADIRRTRNIGDFSNWKDHDSYQKSLKKLLESLKATTY